MEETILMNSLESMKNWKSTIRMFAKNYSKLNKRLKKMEKKQRGRLRI